MARPIRIFNVAALAAAGVYVSDWIRVSSAPDVQDAAAARRPESYDKAWLRGFVAIPVSSAADGLQFQITEDQITILTIATTTLTVAAPGTLEQFRAAFAMSYGKFFRIRYVNGGVALAAATWVLAFWPEDDV